MAKDKTKKVSSFGAFLKKVKKAASKKKK